MNLTLIRKISFRALHAYRYVDLSEAENLAQFGELALPHPHEFIVEVGVTGPRDHRSGFVANLADLDRALKQEVLPLRDKLLNDEISAFQSGHRFPSCENLAIWFHGQLSHRLPDLSIVWTRVWESDDLGAEFRPSRR